VTTCGIPNLPSNPATHDQAIKKGWVTASYRHYKGKKLGPYYFRKWKLGRKTYKQYIKPEDVERVKAACQANRDRRKTLQAGGKKYGAFVDNFRFLGRMNRRFDHHKGVRKDQAEYIVRLHTEGMYITGRPPYRPRRLFGVPAFSNFFLTCLQRTGNFKLAAFLEASNIDPDDVEIDLSPTQDPEMKKCQREALAVALRKRLMTGAFAI
jgi:hypothetical protein